MICFKKLVKRIRFQKYLIKKNKMHKKLFWLIVNLNLKMMLRVGKIKDKYSQMNWSIQKKMKKLLRILKKRVKMS